jgi:hypothetical protein
VSAATPPEPDPAAGPEAFVLALIVAWRRACCPTPPADHLDERWRSIDAACLRAELNTVRKHLSVVKGGGLLRMVRGRGVRTLILSDVVGDDPSTIGSGPTVADPTTFADARAVLRKYDLVSQVPPPVLAVLEAGSRGEAEETIKPTDPLAAHATATVIGDNLMACRAAAACAARLGYEPIVDDELPATPPRPRNDGGGERRARRWCDHRRRDQRGRR